MFVEARAVAFEVALIALDVPDGLLGQGIEEAERILANSNGHEGVDKDKIRAQIDVIKAVRTFQARLMEIEAGR